MNKIRISIQALALVLLTLCFASFAQAQASRTWVSGVGDDANPCSRTAPCKTFAGAISKTAAGGEIDALDPGGYGAVTITKSITIDGGGGLVTSILATAGNGVQAGGGTAPATVQLFGVVIMSNFPNGMVTASNGSIVSFGHNANSGT